MLKNYLTVAIRNIMRYKVYSFINIAGLAIGMACCALILLYVQHELSYDDFHSKGDRIYRVLRETHGEDGSVTVHPGISGAFAPALLKDFPEVETAVRILGSPSFRPRNISDRSYGERRPGLFVEPHFFTVFDFPFLQGNPEIALREPNSLVLSEEAARRYFGAENPLGKLLTVEFIGSSRKMDYDLVVTGIIRVPANSVLQFDMATSTATLINTNEVAKDRWERWDRTYHVRPFKTYVLLREGSNSEALEAKLPAFMERYMGAEIRERNTYHLQPLQRIHLYHQADYPGSLGLLGLDLLPPDYADIQNVYLFSGIAVLILLIACVNFMNLATARSANRAKEVGLRKVSGAHRLQLIQQFLGEAVLLSFLAFLLALALVELTLPYFSAFAGKNLAPQRELSHLVLVPALVAFVGLLAGGYPAFFLSAFEPVAVLKGRPKTGIKGAMLRKGLVVFQFAMSILLIIGTVMVYRQLDYMQHKKLGFSKEHIVDLLIFHEAGWSTTERAERYETVKQAFLAHPHILKATAYGFIPGSGGHTREVRTETGDVYQILGQTADEDFLKTFEIALVDGRNFRNEDKFSNAVLLNETAVRMLGWKDPIGKQVSITHTDYTIIGVVRDFHNQSLHEKIKPLMIRYKPLNFFRLALKIRGENLPETIAFIEKTWKQFVPDKPPAFTFLDESLNQLYRDETRFGQLVGVFAGLAIVVACLGLFGLAAFTAEQRTKEIGVRKVLGASVSSIVLLLSKEFARLVLIANLIAWPVAYFLVGNWLQNFAYRVDLPWWVFALGGVTALVIALGTVVYQALRTALANPIQALRYE